MLKIKTTKLQEMLSRAVQGASNNKLDPITCLLALELKGGKLTITTTDKINYLYVTEDMDGDDFYVCVPVDKFPKLIARLTCEDVSLDLTDKFLEVKGNGTYQIEFQLDDSTGEMVVFPNPMQGIEWTEVGEVNLATLKAILTNIRPALATKGRPQYMNYYAGEVGSGDVVIATDTNKISALKAKMFTDGKARLISAEMMNLLDTMTDDSIKIYADGSRLAFKAEHGTVFGYTPDGVEQFSADKIADYIEKEYKSSCKVSKVEMLQVLDRISLFVDYLDNDIIDVAFEEDGLIIRSRKNNGEEKIPYIECTGFTQFSGIVLLDRLRTQVKSQAGDIVNIHFGEPRALKLTDSNSIFVLALGSEQ